MDVKLVKMLELSRLGWAGHTTGQAWTVNASLYRSAKEAPKK
jgi:hypothetical protein